MTSAADGAAPFHFDRTWVFPLPPERFWRVISRTGDFPRWWPWLRRLEGDGLVEGREARCLVRAPIPYSLEFTVAVEQLEPGRLVDATVTGDLSGPARLEVAAHPDGSEVHLAWRMELRRPLLRAAARVARPVMEWGHDWVVANGVEQFLRRALRVGTVHDNRTRATHPA